MDTKKLSRIVRSSHRITGDRHDLCLSARREFAHVAMPEDSPSEDCFQYCCKLVFPRRDELFQRNRLLLRQSRGGMADLERSLGLTADHVRCEAVVRDASP